MEITPDALHTIHSTIPYYLQLQEKEKGTIFGYLEERESNEK